MRKALSIAYQAIQGYSRDRLFHAVSVFGLIFILFSTLLSSLTIVDHEKVLLDFGLAAISLVGVGFSVLLGSSVVRKELDNCTIYTILSKPVRREEYLLGKLIGVAFVVTAIHAVSGLLLALMLWIQGGSAPAGLVSAVYLMTQESLLVSALALASSLFFSSSFVAVAIVIACFLLGRSSHLISLMAERAESNANRQLLRALNDIVPSLQRFDIRDLVAYHKAPPEGMVLTSSVYCLAYLVVLVAVSLLLFRKKDLS